MKLLKGLSSARGTKRALIASAACTLLCGLLLFSTSIAWFTANRESSVNELYSGNLDVVLSYSKDMNAWSEVKDSTNDIFKVGDENMLWEPGAVNVVYFKIENKGSLAAKYDFALAIENEVGGTNFNDQPFKLSDYIKGGVVKDISNAYAATDVGRTQAIADLEETPATLSAISGSPLITGTLNGTNGITIEGQSTKTFALVLYMPDDIGDVTNYKTETEQPKVSLKIKLVATQDVGEADSFGDQYDKGAVYTDVTATTPAELTSAIGSAQNGAVIGIGGNDMALTQNLTVEKNVTIVGDGEHAIENYPTYVGADYTVTFKNVKFDKTTATDNASSVYGQGFKGTVIFDGCTFDLNRWEAIQITPSGDCTIVIRNCTFNGYEGAKRFIHIQPNGNGSNTFKLNVTITDCTFNNCDKVNYVKSGQTLQDDNKGSVIDLDYFAQGSTVTMGGNTFNLSSGVTNYPLHPYFCTAPYENAKELCGETLLGYLQGTIKTYTVTASGLN